MTRAYARDECRKIVAREYRESIEVEINGQAHPPFFELFSGDRRVGIKSREVYECPGALALVMAHQDLESITLERDLAHEKARLEPRYAYLVYDGLWYSPLKEALDAFVDESQRFVDAFGHAV